MKKQIQLTSTVGILSPLLPILSIVVIFIINRKDFKDYKEANKIIGLWTPMVILSFSLFFFMPFFLNLYFSYFLSLLFYVHYLIALYGFFSFLKEGLNKTPEFLILKFNYLETLSSLIDNKEGDKHV